MIETSLFAALGGFFIALARYDPEQSVWENIARLVLWIIGITLYVISLGLE